jgi:hypothetical protein
MHRVSLDMIRILESFRVSECVFYDDDFVEEATK